MSNMPTDAGSPGITAADAMPRLLTTEQTAQILGISPSTLAKARVFGGKLPFVKLGRSVRYRLEDILSFIDQQTRVSTSQPA
jgi:excisionase family DNA binding protein